ncbi:hypothetical protein [Spongiactinospora gelatinilytica]|uniref:hypothetical protein n=1 Tax=Spongiactinospora gelatinilytica TaxID=2666298 RepID=UPI0011B943F4|nr:hypothetical protein [Spongiactinospora gelatinilytica]
MNLTRPDRTRGEDFVPARVRLGRDQRGGFRTAQVGGEAVVVTDLHRLIVGDPEVHGDERPL